MAEHSQPPHLQPAADSLPFSRPSSPGIHPTQLGFVGLGAMGYPMARNLASHRQSHPKGSLPLVVWNRTRAKSEQLLKELGPEKIKIADSPAQVAKECDVIVTNLANDEVVKSTYEAFRLALKDVKHDKPKIFVESSTIYPKLAGELDDLISDFPHTHLITCPVFGPPAAADKAQLILVMSGDYRSKKEAAYLLVPAVGRKVVDLGGNLEKAPTFKLIGNSLIIGIIEAMSESLTLGEKSGIGAEEVYNLIKDMMPAPPLIGYGAKMVHDEFDGLKGFAIDGGLKDASHMRRLTSEHNCPMPIIDIAHQHMITARALHAAQKAIGTQTYDVLDWSALIAGSRVAAGLDGFDSAKHSKVIRED